jgi:hypothetical protein
MPTIVTYKMKDGECMGSALWSSGVYRKKDFRTAAEVVKGLPPRVETHYDCAYLVNGHCVNCRGVADHQPWCSGSSMKKIINLVFPLCAMCHYTRVGQQTEICSACYKDAEACSCYYTPDCCSNTDKHDKAYYAVKRAEWKAKLASMGITNE